VKKLLIIVFLMTLSSFTLASYNVSTNVSPVPCKTLEVPFATCGDLKPGLLSCMNINVSSSDWQDLTCSVNNPLTAGVVVTFKRVFKSTSELIFTNYSITSVALVCDSGQHYDSSTNTCVDDITIAVASCMPSIRTISPCPSGYAPTNAIPAGSGAPNPFISAMDGMPLQDMIYAVGIAICGLMGIAVGVKLV